MLYYCWYLANKCGRCSILIFAAATSLSAISGCDGGGVQTYPVTVKLSLPDGSVPKGAVVTFQPVADEGEKRSSAICKIGPDGTCQLMTFKPGDGAVAGQHRVTVAPSIHESMAASPSKPPSIHPRYRNFATSGIEVTVSPDGPNEIAIALVNSK